MTAKPTVLFVCVHNAGRSQMAAALLARHGGDAVEVRSAGSAPAERINPEAVRYVNRVSDFLFVAGRVVNDNGNSDVLWVPGGNR